MVHKMLVLTTLVAVACLHNTLADGQSVPQVANIDMNNIKVQFTFTPLELGPGASVTIEGTSGLSRAFALNPTVGFEYHVHVSPVGPNNDCMATGGHLDPTQVGAAKCDPAAPEKCQVGDLSGKHGNLAATDSGAISLTTYQDKQLAFEGEASVVGRSVVIHNNGARVACANIVPATGDEVEGSSAVGPAKAFLQTQPNTGSSSKHCSGHNSHKLARVAVSAGAAMSGYVARYIGL